MASNNDDANLKYWIAGSVLLAIPFAALMFYGSYLSRDMTWQRLEDAHDAGFISGAQGVALQDNPYKPGDNKYEQWIKGWQQGFIDAKKEKSDGK